MLKKILNRIKINFRQSSSERKAQGLYRNYHKRLEKYFNNIKALAGNAKFKNKEKI